VLPRVYNSGDGQPLRRARGVDLLRLFANVRHGGRPMSEAEGGVPPVPDAIADAPPSRKLIVWAFFLVDEERLTQQELRELTGLSLGAVSQSLRDLRDAGLIQKRPDPSNPVGHCYEFQI